MEMETILGDRLFDLEVQFWRGDSAFYRKNLADEAVMVFPDPAGVMIKDEICSSVDDAPRWEIVELEEHRLMELDENAAVVTYKATAMREGEVMPYVARASSTYVRDGGRWKLAFHQQTPLAIIPAVA
jgi:Domain of unknown function (DUF4440)